MVRSIYPSVSALWNHYNWKAVVKQRPYEQIFSPLYLCFKYFLKRINSSFLCTEPFKGEWLFYIPAGFAFRTLPFTHRRLLCAYYGSTWERLVLCQTLIVVCYNREVVCLLCRMNRVFKPSVPASVHCTLIHAFRVNIFKTPPLCAEVVA